MKQIVETEYYCDWINILSGKSVECGIEYLKTLDCDAVLCTTYNYDSDETEGYIETSRLETDQEYAERLDKETTEVERKRLATLMAEEGQRTREEKLLQSKVAQDVAIWAYLQKHKDNPHKADLDNLYRAMIQLERDGHNPNGAAMRGIKECMEELELLG